MAPGVRFFFLLEENGTWRWKARTTKRRAPESTGRSGAARSAPVLPTSYSTEPIAGSTRSATPTTPRSSSRGNAPHRPAREGGQDETPTQQSTRALRKRIRLPGSGQLRRQHASKNHILTI